MRLSDGIRFAFDAVRAQRTRSILTALAIAVGIGAVVLLTSLGEGMHRFVLSEFTQFGTRLIAVSPGRTTTMGMSGALINTIRPLTLDDMRAIEQLRGVEAAVPMIIGNAAVESPTRSRRTSIYGVGPRMPEVWQFELASGRFLADAGEQARAQVVLGASVRRELFGTKNPLGEAVRIGGFRFRVVGTMRPKGQFLGFDLDDAVYIPAGRGLELFDRESLMEIDVLFGAQTSSEAVERRIRRVLMARHGLEDFTLTSQEQMLDVLGSVLTVLTFAVGALGGISLLVAGVGILTIMTIAIRERTREIGLLRAIGATRGHVLTLFLAEAAALAALGGVAGLVFGYGAAAILHFAIPDLPIHPSLYHALIAEAVATGVGLLAGVAPALHAARLDPVDALRAE